LQGAAKSAPDAGFERKHGVEKLRTIVDKEDETEKERQVRL